MTIFEEINPKGHKIRIKGKLISIDIYIPEINVGIEFDGSYWHKNNEVKDKMKTLDIEDSGLKIYRVRQRPLKRIFDDDIMASEDFNAKHITNDVLKQILKNKENYHIEKSTVNKISRYLKIYSIQNKQELENYIEMILNQKAKKY